MEPTNNTKSKKGLGIGIAVVAMAVVVFVTYSQSSNKQTLDKTVVPPIDSKTSGTPVSTEPKVKPVTTPVDTKKTSIYKDGTYTAVGSYMSPGGSDNLGVTLTLKSDIVTDVSLDLQAGDRTSERYQNIFAGSYKQYVIGKNISALNLGKISSSSLTPRGFNNAIADIRTQAKA
ncbi:MAG: hypothetical protein WCK91_00885 [bacterium]